MSGLRKQKEYDWKDSNVENIGSDKDRRFKKETAQKEPAWNRLEDGLEDGLGLKIWRIEKFEVKDWPKEKYGEFFNGDSYIILHAEKNPDSDEINYDVHFWIGSKSTQDEYGTAAYKTVELDTYLDDKAVQHREVAKKESDEFKEYFGDKLKIVEGGIESGFNKVVFVDTITVVHYKQVNGKYQDVTEPYAKKHLCCDDGYLAIFEKRQNEYRIFQLKGKNAPLSSTGSFNAWMGRVKDGKVEGLEGFGAADFVYFDCQDELEKDDIFKEAKGEFIVKLQRLIIPDDKNKRPYFEEMGRNAAINESLLDSSDVFLLEAEEGVIVWIGEKASTAEKKRALFTAEMYLEEHGQNPNCSISCVREKCGKIPRVWKKYVKTQDKDCQDELEKDDIFKEAKGEFIVKLQRLIIPDDKKKRPYFEEIGRNTTINESLLDSSDVFLLEAEEGVIVWIGEKASPAEEKRALFTAEMYLKEHGQNPNYSISCVREKCGKIPRVWKKYVKTQDKGPQQQARAKGRHSKRM